MELSKWNYPRGAQANGGRNSEEPTSPWILDSADHTRELSPHQSCCRVCCRHIGTFPQGQIPWWLYMVPHVDGEEATDQCFSCYIDVSLSLTSLSLSLPLSKINKQILRWGLKKKVYSQDLIFWSWTYEWWEYKHFEKPNLFFLVITRKHTKMVVFSKTLHISKSLHFQ